MQYPDFCKSRKVFGTACFFMTFFIFLCFAVFLSGQSFAGEKKAVVATLTGYAPFCFEKSSGDIVSEVIPVGGDSSLLQGYSWDVVRESLQAMGYEITLFVVPWARAMHYVETGKADVLFAAGKSEERLKIFDFSKEPVALVKFLIYVPKDFNKPYKGLESFNGKTVAAMRKWTYGDKWAGSDKIHKTMVDNICQGFLLMSKKRVDGFAGYEMVYDYNLRKNKKMDDFIKLPYFDENAEFLAGRKGNKKVKEILDAYDKGKKIITNNGVLEKINKKWKIGN